jgi:hypothetical protein
MMELRLGKQFFGSVEQTAEMKCCNRDFRKAQGCEKWL